MAKPKVLYILFISIILGANNLFAQRGYYDAPYTRYEADLGTLTNATITPATFDQWSLQSEASEQVCVNMSAGGASVEWTVTAAGDGLVVRYSVPDGQSGNLDVYANGAYAGTLNLTSYYSWESLWNNGNPNNAGVSNQAPKMRFDEVRMHLPSTIPVGGTLRLVRTSGNIHVDFAELEPVPAAVTASGGDLTFPGGDLQNYIDNNGGATIYLPPGVYNVNRELYFGQNNTVLKGAGMWYTQIHFTNGSGGQGGLRANAYDVSYSGLYLTTVRNSRSNSYKAINGVYTGGSTITNVWAEHFECGAWIGQYNTGGPTYADGFTVSHCRFRNNYADGINLCRGTRNTIVEHCSFRNNGDDDMAIWSADGMECRSNTFRYNTSENTWRASGCAIYGGYDNKAHNLLIQDNVEVGLRVNNTFPGVGFNGSGLHEFYDITIIRCGTYHDLYHSPVGAIDLKCTNVSGDRVQNVTFSCISILDSKNDGIYINRTSGSGYYNVNFENITIDGTGAEYLDNGGAVGGRGYFVLFNGNPAGYGTYCNMTYANRGGSAGVDVNTGGIGSFSWTQAGSCPGGCVVASTTTMTSGTNFGICDNPITLTATTTAPSGNTVSYIEFFVDGGSIGQDNTSPYSIAWNDPTAGTHSVYAVAHYSGGSTSTSSTQNVTVQEGIYTTPTPPTIDGIVDGIWANHTPHAISKLSVGTIGGGAADLSADFRIMRDATNLYLLVDVTDDDLQNDGGFNWEDDALELFIDMGNDKAGAYGADDFRYSFVHNDATVYEDEHNATAGVVFDEALKAGGYIMEIRIPWATLGGAPADGDYIGFDLHVNDDDGGGTRDAKIAWEDATDNAWQYPSVLGALQVAGCANPQPVELISFEGELINDAVALTWSTASEINNEKFIVERSGDLAAWQAIGEVAGAGNTSTVIHYSYTDLTTPDGITYYRLQQVDYDGTFAYSHVVAVNTNRDEAVRITPNPFDQGFTIITDASGDVTITVYDVLGKVVYTENKNCENGMLEVRPDLVNGTYVIRVQTREHVYQQKLVKK